MSDTVVTPLGNGCFLVERDGRHRRAYGVAAGRTRWIFLEGEVFVLEPDTGVVARSAGGHDDMGLSAPMPATVVLIHVEPGQHVTAGDVLVTLEAMKMELSIRAPRDARVAALACRQGELVQPGAPLVELE